MIDSIQIGGIATYDNIPEALTGLSDFNYIFGSNGTGKTTITRVIADEIKYPTCGVNWRGGTKLQTLVYNRDFVAKNFNQSTELKGIFTLGEKNVDTLNNIATAKGELDKLSEKIEKLNLALNGEYGMGGKRGEVTTLDAEFKNKCWAQKQRHDLKLFGAFEGLRNSSEKFKSRVLQEKESNSAKLESLASLEKRAETVFGPTPTVESSVPTVDMTKILAHESNEILKKRVIGKEDVDIAAMIKKLGNSDWVREGRAFYEVNDKTCPFCQQSTTEVFAKSLNGYFDETFIKDSKAIDDLQTNYKTDSERVQQQFAMIIAVPSKFLDVEKLKTEKALLDSKITVNIQRLATKKKEPSQVIELESLANVTAEIRPTKKGKTMSIMYRTSLAFARGTDHELDGFTENVINSLTGNANFPTPLVPLGNLTDALTDFRVTLAAALNGGRLEIAKRNAARAALVTLLRQEAAYVQSVAGEDLARLLSSGFEAVSNNRTQIPLSKPMVLDVANNMSTQLALRLQAVPTARAYEVRMSYGPNGWQAAGVFTQARKIVVDNLTPGTTYTFQARAIGGSTGSSDWSDPVSHMAL